MLIKTETTQPPSSIPCIHINIALVGLKIRLNFIRSTTKTEQDEMMSSVVSKISYWFIRLLFHILFVRLSLFSSAHNCFLGRGFNIVYEFLYVGFVERWKYATWKLSRVSVPLIFPLSLSRYISRFFALTIFFHNYQKNMGIGVYDVISSVKGRELRITRRILKLEKWLLSIVNLTVLGCEWESRERHDE